MEELYKMIEAKIKESVHWMARNIRLPLIKDAAYNQRGLRTMKIFL